MPFKFKDRSTLKQRLLLKDLWIIVSGKLPTQKVETAWENLTAFEARELIRNYYGKFGRCGNYDGALDEGDPAYEHLSPKGKAFIDSDADPFFDWGSTSEGTYA